MQRTQKYMDNIEGLDQQELEEELRRIVPLATDASLQTGLCLISKSRRIYAYHLTGVPDAERRDVVQRIVMLRARLQRISPLQRTHLVIESSKLGRF